MTGHGHSSKIMERVCVQVDVVPKTMLCSCFRQPLHQLSDPGAVKHPNPIINSPCANSGLTILSPRHLTLHITWLQGDDGGWKYLVMLINRHSSFMLQFL